LRKNVLQVDIPTSTTKTTTYSYNAATGHAPNLRASLHGIESVEQKVLHGRFAEVNVEVNPVLDQATQVTTEAMNIAKKVEASAAKMAGEIVGDPKQMVIPIQVTNARENGILN